MTQPIQRGYGGQRGATMVEFIYVAPMLLLIGLAILQYSLLYGAKNQINHAGFMATRAGSMHNATADSISTAYLRNLAPLYGGGRNAAELAEAVKRATADMHGHYRIELINPTRASFDDFNDPLLKKVLHTDARVIPNSGLAMRDPGVIKNASKQNIFDANLLKVRITHGYQPGVLMVSILFAKALAAADDHKDKFASDLLAVGRIPVSTDITLHMNSDAIEWAHPVWISNGGPKGDAKPPAAPPRNDGPPATTPDDGTGTGTGTGNRNDTTDPPKPNGNPDNFPNGGNDTGKQCGTAACPVCPARMPDAETLPMSADVLFDFDQAILKPGGLQALDDFIKESKAAQDDGQRIEALTISGYTDQLGADDVNQRLSQARATAVRDYMKQQGFPDVPVTVRGMGAADPKVQLSECPGSGEAQRACLAANRRVVIEVKRVKGSA
jgi:outer membrane protein OmpA-like peptidoglycan-associated protein